MIIRPLDQFQGQIPQRTLDRMDVMRGVMAEKTASATWTQTVNPGQEVCFTFTLENFTGYNKTLTVTDTVPQNTTYIAGAQKKNGDTLSWTVSLGAGETVQVSYTVEVGAQAEVVQSSSFVESIPVNCPAIAVGKTLTAEEQNALAAVAVRKDTTGISMAAALYQDALDMEILPGLSADDVLEGAFRYYAERIESGATAYDVTWPPQWRSLDPNSQIFKFVPAGLYGGRSVLEGTDKDSLGTEDFMGVKRTRLLTQDQLVTGDIIVINDNTAKFQAFAWLYVGGQLLDLQTGQMMPAEPSLSQVISYNHFVVIRPSLGM